jgi:hypothetical protein
VLAIDGVRYRTQCYVQVVEGSERSKCFLPDFYRNLLVPAPFPLITHLANKITCMYIFISSDYPMFSQKLTSILGHKLSTIYLSNTVQKRE